MSRPKPQDRRFPEPEPAQRMGELDGLPTTMIVNKSLKGYPFKAEFPFHVWITVGYRSTDELAGLPTPKEERSLSALEDALLAAVRKAATGQYIGRTSWNGMREFNFYVDEPELVDERLEQWAEQQKRPVQYEITEDGDWQHVEFFFDFES